MLVIIGKTASGKSTIVKKLEECGYHRCLQYTTRPRRKGERDGVDYHFVSQMSFDSMRNNGEFAEVSSFKTNAGVWEYASTVADYMNGEENKVIVLNPQSLEQIKQYNPYIIYINSNEKTIRDRLKMRGDSNAEANRRIKADSEDFKDIYAKVDKIVYNNFNNSIDEVVKRIVELDFERKKGS